MEGTPSNGSLFIVFTATLLVVAVIGALVRFGVHKDFLVTVPTPCMLTNPCEVIDCDDIYTQLIGCIEGERALVRNETIDGKMFARCVEAGECQL